MVDHTDNINKKATPNYICEQRFDHVPDWIWEVDPEGNFTYSNRVVKDILGYAVSKVIGQPIFSLLFPDEVGKCRDIFDKAKNTKHPAMNILVHFRHKNGADKVLEVSCVPILDTEHHLTGFRGISRDVGEQLARQRAAEEIQRNYKALIDASPVGITILKGDKIILSNPKIEELTGYTAEEINRSGNLRIIHEDDRERVENYYNRVTSGVGVPLELEVRVITKSGNTRYFDLRAVLIQSDDSPTILINAIDVTARKLAENALYDAEIRYQELVESVPVIVWRGSAETFEFTFVSKEAENMLGYPIERWTDDPTFWQDHLHPDDRDWVISACTVAKRELRPHDLEYRMVAADGSIVWIHDIVQEPVKVSDSKEEVFGAMINITARKHAEDALKRSEEEFRNLVENTTDWVWEVDENIIYTYASPRIRDLLGYDPEEIVGTSPFDYMPPEEAKRVGDIFWPISERHEPFTLLDNTLVREDGHLIVVETNGTPIFDEQGTFKGYRGIDRDITERKLYARRLEQLNECFLSFDPDPMANINSLTALAGELLGATCALYNRLEGGLLCAWGQWHTPPEFIAVDTPEGHICYDVIRQGMKEPFIIRNLPTTPYAQTDPTVSKFHLQTYIGHTVIFNGKPVGSICCVYQGDYVPTEGDKWFLGIIASAIAVEERRRCAEQELRESEEQYKLLFESNPNPMWVYDLETCEFLAVNTAAIHQYGYSREEFLSMTIKDIRPPEDIPALLENISCVTSGLDEAGEWRHIKKDGTVIDVEITSHTIDFSGRRAELVLAYDITDRKRAEDALRANETLLKQFVEHTPAAVAMFDKEMRYLLYSKRWLIDYKLGDRDITGLLHYEVFPDVPERWKEIHQSVLAGNVERCEEDEFVRADGSVEWIRWEEHPWWNEAGEIGGMIMFTEVITERKQMENALLEAETKYRSLVEESLVGVYILQDDRFVYVNPRLAEMMGYTQEEMTAGLTPMELVAPESRELVAKNIEDRITGKAKSRHYIVKTIRKDGTKIDIEVLGSVTVYKDKPAIIGSILDITDRVRSEDVTRSSEERYRILFENSPDIVFVIRGSLITAVNPAVRRILGYEPSEVIGRALWEISPEYQPRGITSKNSTEKYITPALSGEPQIFEWIHKRKDGSLVFCDVNVTSYELHGEYFIQAIVRDVTERKRVEEARRRYERQIERQKRQFYRDTIMSVTDGKLNIADTADVKPYLSHSQLQVDMHNVAEVADARHEVERFFRENGLKGERLSSFMIGVGEAMANAVKHGIRGRVFVGTTDEAVWVGIADQGKGIESFILPRATLLRGFSTKPSMGLGYTIMLDVADRIILKTGEHGTIVILIKNREESVVKISTELLPDTWSNIPDV